ncbi:ribonuclease PH [Poriferisphaera sp. WC338]|uniref:ribonuclease PH n=1 Tax=Poriferisphaera sp. WC338 TaxID=3425129 RepID=UPI003D818D3C
MVKKKITKRRATQMREVKIKKFDTAASGSVMIEVGETKVLCTASVASRPPKWLPQDDEGNFVKGWVTAEYNMMPGSTPDRKKRGPDSRGTEIQRLIARALRAAVDLEKMPGVMITCDCDVVKADGGTRTASITGAWVALAMAVKWAMKEGLIAKNPIKGPVAAVSVGVIDGEVKLDLDYEWDVRAEVDMNVAMNHKGAFVEVQGTGEAGVFSRAELDGMLDAAEKGIRKLMRLQKAFVK